MPNPHLPVETLDNIVDHLHDTDHALRNCCLVSKSWIPRTRTHLFADVRFAAEADLKSWKETFPDPPTSPAHYTKSLTVSCAHVVTTADAEAGGWITGFSRVVHFEIGSMDLLSCGFAVTFAPFHGFSPRIKSLCANFIFLLSPQIFDLAVSFPLLEDLSVIAESEVLAGNNSDGLSTTPRPSSLPMFTGSLKLESGGINPITRRLLSLPGGIQFRKLTLGCIYGVHLVCVTGLIAGCSNTLESLCITCDFQGEARSIDLSNATRLKHVVFKLASRKVEWITLTLQTITQHHRDLRKISISVYWEPGLARAGANVREIVGEQIYGQWLDLDRALNQIWGSLSTRPKLVCVTAKARLDMEDYIVYLLPEMTKRGAIDLFSYILE